MNFEPKKKPVKSNSLNRCFSIISLYTANLKHLIQYTGAAMGIELAALWPLRRSLGHSGAVFYLLEAMTQF